MRGLRRRGQPFLRVAVLVATVGASRVQAAAAQSVSTTAMDVIRVNDSLSITVRGQAALTGTYSVDADGTIRLPIIGQVPAANLTLAGVTDLLTQRLDAFIQKPDVHVSVVRPASVFVTGEVSAPGQFPLTRGLTVVEALTQAGYTGSGEVLLLRTPGALGPLLPDQVEPSHVIRINLRELEKAVERGDLSSNVRLEPNDTVFVPKIDPTLVYVIGRVHKPGAYSVADGTTVLQAVTLAGGPTDDAAINRVRVSRWTEAGGDRRARLTDSVRPGDAIAVPEAFRIPSVINTPAIDPGAPRAAPFRIGLGPHLALSPSFVVSRIGADTSVFNQGEELRATSVAVFGPAVGLTARTSRVNVEFSTHLSMAILPQHSDENSLQPGYGIAPTVTVAPWLSLHSRWSVDITRDHWTTEIDLLARRREERLNAGMTIGLLQGATLSLDADDYYNRFDANQTQYGIDLDQVLSERIRGLRAAIELPLTVQSSVIVSGGVATHRFPTFSPRDANGSEVGIGVRFKPTASLQGEAQFKWTQYFPLVNNADPFDGPAGLVMLSRMFGDRTEIGGLGERVTEGSLGPQFAYAIVDRKGAFLHQMLSRRLDAVAQVFNERFQNRPFFRLDPATPNRWGDFDTWRYTGGLGVRVGSARVAANVSLSERVGPINSVTLLVWMDVSYGVFQVRGR